MIACNHLDDQSISKLLMKSTSKKIPFCAHKIPFCAHKIPFCAHKAVFAFDLICCKCKSVTHCLSVCSLLLPKIKVKHHTVAVACVYILLFLIFCLPIAVLDPVNPLWDAIWEKNGIMWEKFPNGGHPPLPPPQFGNFHIFLPFL